MFLFSFFFSSLSQGGHFREREREREREQREDDEEGGRRMEGGEGVREACVQNPQRFCNKCIDDNKNKNIKGRKDVFLC